MYLYHSEVGVLLVAITYVMCFLVLVWLSARSINNSDKKRQKLQNNLLEIQQQLATTLTSIGDAVISTDIKGNSRLTTC